MPMEVVSVETGPDTLAMPPVQVEMASAHLEWTPLP